MDRIKAFFSRIGLDPDTQAELTYGFLKKLQFHCVTNIAYENLDILDGVPISQDPEMLYDKIVTRGRGGYCFEVNGLLAYMLRLMGFDVSERFARYLRGEQGIPMRRHRVAVVSCDEGEFLCDIGIGQSAPRYPVKLVCDTVQEQFGEAYRFTRDRELGWVLCDLHAGKWRQFFSFTDDVQYDVDFIQPSFWCEHHPDSPFNKAPMLAIKTEQGRKTLDGRVYKEFCGDTLTHIEENVSDARFWRIITEEFRLNYPENGLRAGN